MCRNVEKKNDLLAKEIASLEKELEKLEEALRELDPEHELLCNSNT
jgi:prefoldin subunit 5